jgi:hypothetical protein
MFILDGRPLSPDVPFEHDGISYPANWLRLASPEERAAIGITEEPDPAPYDQRFYWGPDLPKDHTQLVEQWTQQTRVTAGTLLTPTDWYVVRELDNNTPTPVEMKDWRQAIRTDCETKIAAIEATTTTAELAAYITGADYPAWPADPYAPQPPAEEPEAAV